MSSAARLRACTTPTTHIPPFVVRLFFPLILIVSSRPVRHPRRSSVDKNALCRSSPLFISSSYIKEEDDDDATQGWAERLRARVVNTYVRFMKQRAVNLPGREGVKPWSRSSPKCKANDRLNSIYQERENGCNACAPELERRGSR